MDLIGCGLSKLGIPNGYNNMCANDYNDGLKEDPDHHFVSSVHSRGGIQMMNTGRMLTRSQRQHIDVISYGSATLIPNDYFRSAVNYISAYDVVAMTNPIAYGMGRAGVGYDVRVLPSASRCPLKVHGLLEATHADEITRRGREFKRQYFHQ